MVSETERKEAIFKHHYNDMISVINTKSKQEAIKRDYFTKVQEYSYEKSVINSRMAFKIRSHMVPKILGYFKNRYKGKGTISEGLNCQNPNSTNNSIELNLRLNYILTARSTTTTTT